jgi:hypothetical protein
VDGTIIFHDRVDSDDAGCAARKRVVQIIVKKKKAANKHKDKKQADTAPSQAVKKGREPVLLTEHDHITITYRPRLIKAVSVFFMILFPLLLLIGLFAMYHARNATNIHVVFWPGFFLCVATILGWPMVMALHRLPGEPFACFGFMKYFLKLKRPYLVLTSYSGKCPLCYKKLNLIFNFPGSLAKRDNYFAKCSEKSEHTFPPSRIQLVAEKVQ